MSAVVLRGLLAGSAALVLAGGVGLFFRRGQARLAGEFLIAFGALVLVAAFVWVKIPSDRPANVSIAIVEPRSGSFVEAGESIRFRVRINAPIAASPADREGGHLHLYVDGELQQMPYAKEATFDLAKGRHQVEVEYVDNRHVSYDPEIVTSIHVTGR